MPDPLTPERLREIDKILGNTADASSGFYEQELALIWAGRDLRAEVERLRSVCDEFIYKESHGEENEET